MKTNRRLFLQQLGLLSSSLYFGAGCQKSEEMDFALILYTVRDLMEKDFMGTLDAVAEIGYKAVEFAGFYDHSPQKIKEKLDALGIAAISVHEGFDKLEINLQKVIDSNLSIGNKNIVCPSMPGKYRNDGVDGAKAFSEQLNRFGETVKNAGMQLHYHNHAYEFENIDGTTRMDVLLQKTDPQLVMIQFDVYWLRRGGKDPKAMISKYSDRCSLIHMKDMGDDEEMSDVPIGTGILDIGGIINASRKAGIKWCIVEQDNTKRPALEAIEISYKNMSSFFRS
ncbi:TIM barrel protein [candidate division KSB1 bacterium]|nr:TIM barrel protein [candidate division KSB1 bacterium]